MLRCLTTDPVVRIEEIEVLGKGIDFISSSGDILSSLLSATSCIVVLFVSELLSVVGNDNDDKECLISSVKLFLFSSSNLIVNSWLNRLSLPLLSFTWYWVGVSKLVVWIVGIKVLSLFFSSSVATSSATTALVLAIASLSFWIAFFSTTRIKVNKEKMKTPIIVR